MNTLHVYGDSYVDNDTGPHEYWTNNVACELNLKQVNYGKSGSSTEFSMLQLLADINRNTIVSGDVVIFSASGYGRLTFRHQQQFPTTSSKYRYNLLTNNFDESLSEHRWYRENKEYLKWYIINSDPNIEKLHHEGCLHIIKNLAESRPDIIVVLLEMTKYELTYPMNLPRNLLRPNIMLNSISGSEFAHSMTHNDFVKYTKIDPRINHFSINNARIFARLIVEAIKTGSTEHITLDKFEKNIYDSAIMTLDDYNHYVKSGQLFVRPSITRILK